MTSLLRANLKGNYTEAQARAIMESSRNLFNRLTHEDRLGQREEQGGNYYLEDPVERANFWRYVEWLQAFAQTTGNRRVLVGACGDGLEIELLQDYNVTGFDFAPNMIAATRNRLHALGYSATLHEDNAVDLSGPYQGNFAGVMFAQAAAFIPPVGPEDKFLRQALTNLVAQLAHGGLFYFSTTHYPNPQYIRPWRLDGEIVGETIYFGRPPTAVAKLLRSLGIVILHQQYFDSHTVWEDESYINYYFIGYRI